MSADGPLLDAVQRAKSMLRDTHAWRHEIGSSWSTAVSASHIYFDGLPPPDPGPDHSRSELQQLRPFALLWADTSTGLRLHNATGGYCQPIPSGTIIMQIEMPVPSAYADDPPALAEDVMRKLGRVMRTGDAAEPGLFELSGLAGYLPLRELTLTGYVRTDRKDAAQVGDVTVAEIQIDWGLTA